VIEDVGQDNVDAPVKEAAREDAGILDADTLLQLSLLPFPWSSVTCDH
jgi:hypothetical protein